MGKQFEGSRILLRLPSLLSRSAKRETIILFGLCSIRMVNGVNMDIKNYQKLPEKPLTFEEWKGNRAVSFSDEKLQSINRLHSMDMKKDFEEMLKNEYQEYLDNLNGSWLNR
jgi:hypothetical protein